MSGRVSRGFAPVLLMAGGWLLAVAALAGASGQARALVDCDAVGAALDTEEQQFLTLLNGYRQANGLGALTNSTNLNRGAAWIVGDMATNHYFAHTDSLGRTPYQRGLDCGYPEGAGENLAGGWDWDTAQEAFDAWKASAGHNANMLGSFYTQAGVARLYDPNSDYGWYWATTFGAASDGTGGQATSTPTTTPTSTPAATLTATPTATAPAATATPSPTPSPTSSPAPPTATPTRTSTPGATATTRPPVTPTPASAPATAPGNVTVRKGANLLLWTGNPTNPAVPLGGAEGSVAYRFDSATGTWQRYGADLPANLNTLTTLRAGEAYWVIASREQVLAGWR